MSCPRLGISAQCASCLAADDDHGPHGPLVQMIEPKRKGGAVSWRCLSVVWTREPWLHMALHFDDGQTKDAPEGRKP